MMHSIERCLVSVVSCFRVIREGVSAVVGCLHDAERSEDRVAVRAARVMCASWLLLFSYVPRFAE